jgi:hypothetical protein
VAWLNTTPTSAAIAVDWLYAQKSPLVTAVAVGHLAHRLAFAMLHIQRSSQNGEHVGRCGHDRHGEDRKGPPERLDLPAAGNSIIEGGASSASPLDVFEAEPRRKSVAGAREDIVSADPSP